MKTLNQSDYLKITNFDELLRNYVTSNPYAINYHKEIVYLEQNKLAFKEIAKKIITKGVNALTSDEARLWEVITQVATYDSDVKKKSDNEFLDSYNSLKKFADENELSDNAKNVTKWGVSRFDKNPLEHKEKLENKLENGMSDLSDDEVKDLQFVSSVNEFNCKSKSVNSSEKQQKANVPTKLNKKISELTEDYLSNFFMIVSTRKPTSLGVGN